MLYACRYPSEQINEAGDVCVAPNHCADTDNGSPIVRVCPDAEKRLALFLGALNLPFLP